VRGLAMRMVAVAASTLAASMLLVEPSSARDKSEIPEPTFDDFSGAGSRATLDNTVPSDIPSHIPASSPEDLGTPQVNGQRGRNFLMYRLLEAFVNKRQGSTRWVSSHRVSRRRRVPFRMAFSPAS
jgi:hypothetical protein